MQNLFKKIATSTSKPPERMTLESGNYTFHYLIANGVVYLTLAEKAYPKKLAFQYLEELDSEFSRLYGPQLDTVTRPYAFIKFGMLSNSVVNLYSSLMLKPKLYPSYADTFIQKTKKLYLDTRTQRNISKLNQDIAEVHSIMTRNIQDVLGQGERLDRTLLYNIIAIVLIL